MDSIPLSELANEVVTALQHAAMRRIRGDLGEKEDSHEYGSTGWTGGRASTQRRFGSRPFAGVAAAERKRSPPPTTSVARRVLPVRHAARLSFAHHHRRAAPERKSPFRASGVVAAVDACSSRVPGVALASA